MTKTKQKKKETTATITMPIDCTGATINMEKDCLHEKGNEYLSFWKR